MIALTSLLLAAATTFGGGTVDDLAKSLAESTGKNAVIVTASEVPTLAKFSYDTSSADTLSRTVVAGSHLRMAPGIDPLFSDRIYVGDHFREIAPRLPGAPKETTKIPTDMLKDGKVTLQTAGATPIEMSAFADVKWSKPIKFDYLLRDLAVSASVKDMPERDFLSAVAKAAGAFLTADNAGYRMAYDPSMLQTRVIETLKRETPGAPRQINDAKRDFYVAAVGILPFETLVPIFQAPDFQPRLDVLPNTDLATAAVAYIKDIESMPARPFGGTPDGESAQPIRPRGGQDILSRVDNRAMVHLRMNGSGGIILSVPVLRGRTSSYVDM